MRIIAERVRDLDLAGIWPKDEPLIAFVGSGRFHVFVTAFSEVPFAEAASFSWPRPVDSRSDQAFDGSGKITSADLPPFSTGFVGLIAYDGAPHRAFRVHQSLVVDRERRVLWLGESDSGDAACFKMNATKFLRLIRGAQGLHAAPGDDAAELLPQGFDLVPLEADAEYLERAEAALEDIKSGRYYQINLLRRFRLAAASPPRAAFLSRLATHGGPFAVAFDLPDLTLVSFSPERFVSVRPSADGHSAVAETWPIKGTSARHDDPAEDRAAAEGLRRSAKDLAELAMIVDLMRNDLGRVAVKGSVAVPEPLILTTHANVHHLSARVTATLRPQTTLAALIEALCPGGSITGAPKKEVMAAIETAENGPRGYFMGNAFYLDDRGMFDSSILIRTIVRQGEGPYEFAAGSGIVVKSDPKTEMAEIAAKAKVVGRIVAN